MDTVLFIISAIGAPLGFVMTLYYSYVLNHLKEEERRQSTLDKLLISFSVFGLCMHGLFTLLGRYSTSIDPFISYNLASICLAVVAVVMVFRTAAVVIKSMLHETEE